MIEALFDLLFILLFIVIPIIIEVVKKKKRQKTWPQKGWLDSALEEVEETGREIEEELAPEPRVTPPPATPPKENRETAGTIPPLTELLEDKLPKSQLPKAPPKKTIPAEVARRHITNLRHGVIWSQILQLPVSRRKQLRWPKGYGNASQNL